MIEIAIRGRVPSVIPKRTIRTIARQTFRAARRPDVGSLSISFVTEKHIRKMNRTWRRMDQSTDVLAFESPPIVPPMGSRVWGDIFISPSYVRRSAKIQSVPYAEELIRVTSHGILHLLGFDHCTPAETKRMFPLQERVVRAFTKTV